MKVPRDPISYSNREYRAIGGGKDLVSSLVRIKDSDLQIWSEQRVEERATGFALQYRLQVEDYIGKHPDFQHSMIPLKQDPLAPPLIREMLDAGIQAGVGPMAAVAGGIAEYMGNSLLGSGCREVIVENGGDIFIKRDGAVTLAIFAGESPLSLKVGVKIAASRMPLGVCTSSGTVGHSLSLGMADSVTVIAKSTLLADAAATRLGNEVGRERDIEGGLRQALEASRSIKGLAGVVVIRGDRIGAVGEVELVRLNQ